jgi:DNA end-binding protein Ku
MAARPIWKGQLRLSLVSIAVELFTATKSGARVSFRQIHEPSGKPIHYEKVAAGVGPVEKDDIAKGYEVERGHYVLLSEDEVDAVKLETKKTFELVQFVGACEIPPLYFDKPYYLLPADDLAHDAYRVIRDALRTTETVGLGQLTLRGREYIGAVKACGDGLLLETLHYADEVRRADPVFKEISGTAADDDLLEVATALIEKKRAPFDAKAFTDNYTIALKELIDRKVHSKRTKKITAAERKRDEREAGRSNVVDLMAALKKSLGKSGSKPAAPAKTAGAPRKTAARKAAPRKRSA